MTSAQTVEEINSLVSERATLRERVEALEARAAQLDAEVRSRMQEVGDVEAALETERAEGDRLVASDEAAWKRVATAEAKLLELEHRPLHLVVRDGQWVDGRCKSKPPCSFHPDDDNGSHGGRMHVHECAAEHQGGSTDG